MAVIFVGGLFYFKNKVKFPIWESFKTVLMVILTEFVVLRLSVFQGDDERVLAGLFVFYALAIIITGLKMYRFRDRKYIAEEKQISE